LNIMPNAHLIPYKGQSPRLHESVLVATGAAVIGDTEIGADSSVWFNVVIRGDVHHIRIGERTNIQDNSTVHVTSGVSPCIIGNDVTIGHNAIVHACTVKDFCLIGMGALILDRAVIGEGSIVAAGSVVTMGKEFPPNSLIMGAPAKVVKTLTEKDRERLAASAQHYVETATNYKVDNV
jgi:gamma-carbonic anhydrase